MNATWELIPWKVRHLKSSFKKASDWRKSTGAGLLESDAGSWTVEGKVLQMYPHYKQLTEIFGEKVDDSLIEQTEPTMELSFVLDTVVLTYSQEIVVSTPDDISKKPSPVQASDVVSATATQSTLTNVPKKAKDFAEKLMKNAPKTSAAHLATFQVERTEMFKIKLEWEKEKYEKDLAMNERKLKLEDEKVKQELDLKVLEFQKDGRLKILQIEKDERLQKFEIEMKYKFQSQN